MYIFLYNAINADYVPSLRLNSHERHVSVYFAVYPTLVLAFRVAEVDGNLQLT